MCSPLRGGRAGVSGAADRRGGRGGVSAAAALCRSHHQGRAEEQVEVVMADREREEEGLQGAGPVQRLGAALPGAAQDDPGPDSVELMGDAAGGGPRVIEVDHGDARSDTEHRLLDRLVIERRGGAVAGEGDEPAEQGRHVRVTGHHEHDLCAPVKGVRGLVTMLCRRRGLPEELGDSLGPAHDRDLCVEYHGCGCPLSLRATVAWVDRSGSPYMEDRSWGG